MPDNNDILLDLISQSIRIEKPNLPDDQLRKLASDVKNIFESLNNGVMQLEDVTQSIVSVCLDLVNKTSNMINNNKVLISSYDLIIEKIDDVAASISNRLKETDILFRQNIEIKDIVDRNLDYISKLPDKLIKSMESMFERSTTLVTSSVFQNIIRIADKIINSFKIFENFMRNPFKIVKDYIFTIKDQNEDIFIPKTEQSIINRKSIDKNISIPKVDDTFNEKNKSIENKSFLTSLKDYLDNKIPVVNIVNKQPVDKLINERTLAGITNIPLNEQIVLNKTAPGVATKWLAKRLEKSGLMTGLIKEDNTGFISNIKDGLLKGLGLASGMHLSTTLRTILPKLLSTLLNPWVLGAVAAILGGILLWKFRKPIGEFLDNIKDSTVKLIGNIKDNVSTKFEDVKNLFISGWENSIETLKTRWDWIIDKWNGVQNIWSNAIGSVKNFWGNIAESASNTYDKTILPLLKNIDNLFSGIFSAGIEEIKKLKLHLDNFTSWIGSFKESIVDFTISSGKKFLEWIKDLKDVVMPKGLESGGVFGFLVGRDANKYRENSVRYNSSLEFTSNIDKSRYALNKVVGEETALQITYDILKNTEAGGRYGAVNRNDSGAVSLGVLQWNANRARDYLKNLYKIDPKLFKDIMGSQILLDLNNKDWSNRTFSTDESRNFAKLLEDPRMRAETDRLALQDISKYFKQARELGIQGQRELSLAASMINQYGYTGFKKLLETRLRTTDFDQIAQIIKEDKSFPFRARRLEEIDQLNNIYKDIKILKEDVSRNINIPETLNSYQQSINSLVVNEIKTGLQGVSENFTKSINDLKTEIKETKNKDDNRGMVEAPLRQIDRSYIGNIPKYIMEMMFGLNIGGEDKKLGGIF